MATSRLSTRLVEWRVQVGTANKPAQGLVIFEASVSYIPDPLAAGGPRTAIPEPVAAVLDGSGYACAPAAGNPSAPGERGVALFTTDSLGADGGDWTWTARPQLRSVNGIQMANAVPAFSFAVPAGTGTLDLAKVQKVPASPGLGTEAAVALVAAAQQAVEEAKEVVLEGAGKAATEAVGKALAEADLVRGDDSRLPSEVPSNDVFFGVTDEDGRRTWLEAGMDGGPTKRVKDIIYGPLGLTPDSDHTEDIIFGVTDEDGRRTDIEVRNDGHFPQRVVDNIGSRLSSDSLAPKLKQDLARQAAAMVDATSVDPADSGYDVILLAGQSNMSGRGTPYDQRTDPPHSRVWQWGSSGTYAGQLSQAAEPLAMVDTPSGIGPGLVFGRWYAGIIPANRQVILVAAAHGGQALVGGTWDPDTPGSNATNSIARANAAMEYAGANARFAGVLWVQGETDGDKDTSGTDYAVKFDKLANRWRKEITGAANAPIVIGGMVPEYLGVGTRTQIADAHAATPARLPNSAYTPGIPGANLGDNNHYNAVGARKLGRAMFAAYLTVRPSTI